MDFVYDAICADTNAPAFPPRELLGTWRTWVGSQTSNCLNESVLVWLTYSSQSFLCTPFDLQLVGQLDSPPRISRNACSKGIGSEGWLLASS